MSLVLDSGPAIYVISGFGPGSAYDSVSVYQFLEVLP